MNLEHQIVALEKAYDDVLRSISKGEWQNNHLLVKRTSTIRKIFANVFKRKTSRRKKLSSEQSFDVRDVDRQKNEES